MRITKAQFLAERAARRGVANPERIQNETWTWLVEEGIGAYAAASAMQAPPERDDVAGFSFERFGQTRTTLPDGRVICIGGEHEDHYDPDFYIYNDVVVLDAEGRCLAIYGYSIDAFPPTDFHTATLVEDGVTILVVGSLGYADERRPGSTPVYRLRLADFAFERVECVGDAPGWIAGHDTRLEGSCLVVSYGCIEDEAGSRCNVDEFGLDLATWTWSRRTRRAYQEWRIARVDEQPLCLHDFMAAKFYEDYPDTLEVARSLPETQNFEALGIELDPRRRLEQAGMCVDYECFDALFVPPVAHAEDRTPEGDPGDAAPGRLDRLPPGVSRRIRLTESPGVVVSYVTEFTDVGLHIEGELSALDVTGLVEDVRAKLEHLQASPCHARLRFEQRP
ncbi:MAG: hypothetical protein KDC95_17115 [Planctomycetes bacterium]|nr:hypothetical protein [Planctomycetota bacterium]